MPASLVIALMGMAAAVMGEGGAVAGEPGASAASAVRPASSPGGCPTMDRIEGAEALLAVMDRTPARAVRLLLKVGPDTALARLRQALQPATVALEPLGRGPWLVAELDAAQLRTLLATCEVQAVQRDQPAPTG
ncbi:hypothetical protein CS062_20830 [Roseateles chitinivorans]|uniref:Uncharacterized protein n=1 Tax=Roseateles chitinivorans TaxID=2917965 RepID=A0A2G9C4I5_9BURK|nr:hypothetical protein [Roseateles chitinivorans]PIM51262.1 hypothetical protein CS062_20830 [Roseateles chitinivorans]